MEYLSNIFDDFDKVVKGEIEIVCNKPTIALAITARTGSTQLCSVLESMKVFGSPDEIFNTRGVVQNIKKRTGACSFVDYINKLTGTDSPCFSFKTSWKDFEPVTPVYRKLFPQIKFFFLDRFDVVSQAFSLYKAIETGRWHSNASTRNEVAGLSADQIDAYRIQELMKSLIQEKYMWEKFFFTERLVVHHFYYEIIKNDWAAASKIMAKEFGFDSVETGEGRYNRLSGPEDEALIEKFKKNHGYSWVSV